MKQEGLLVLLNEIFIININCLDDPKLRYEHLSEDSSLILKKNLIRKRI